jgi:hypothetical protein
MDRIYFYPVPLIVTTASKNLQALFLFSVGMSMCRDDDSPNVRDAEFICPSIGTSLRSCSSANVLALSLTASFAAITGSMC